VTRKRYKWLTGEEWSWIEFAYLRNYSDSFSFSHWFREWWLRPLSSRSITTTFSKPIVILIQHEPRPSVICGYFIHIWKYSLMHVWFFQGTMIMGAPGKNGVRTADPNECQQILDIYLAKYKELDTARWIYTPKWCTGMMKVVILCRIYAEGTTEEVSKLSFPFN